MHKCTCCQYVCRFIYVYDKFAFGARGSLFGWSSPPRVSLLFKSMQASRQTCFTLFVFCLLLVCFSLLVLSLSLCSFAWYSFSLLIWNRKNSFFECLFLRCYFTCLYVIRRWFYLCYFCSIQLLLSSSVSLWLSLASRLLPGVGILFTLASVG